jgi:hypothetical protein
VASKTDSLRKLKVAQLRELAESAGFELRSRMNKDELIELVSQIDDTEAVQETTGLSRHHRARRLRGTLQDSTVSASRYTWHNALENAIQDSIRRLSERFVNYYFVSGMRDLESVIFARSLTGVGSEWQEEGRRLPPQLSLFANPVALVAFQVHERRYRCVKYPPREGNGGFTKEQLERYHFSINSLSKTYSSRTTTLEENPTSPELLAHLFDHLQEEIGAGAMDSSGDTSYAADDLDVRINEVHPARRSAIRDWQTRLEDFYTEQYDHEEEGTVFFTYPVVDAIIPDGTHLVLLLVSPLDENFVDEKVGPEHHCAEVGLAIYDIGNLIHPVVLDELIPQMRQAFGRILFTSMHEEASRALTSSFQAQSAILRHWVNQASRGYQGIVGTSGSREPFDGVKFCEAIVKKILCAEMPGVDTEVYPFNRVFIFQETGTTSRFDKDVPVEVLILEASVLSNNPADRGRYLTRRERQIRGTEDFECDAARKVIKDENRYRFYIHGHKDYLILTKKPTLSEDELLDISRGVPSSYSAGDPDERPFLIPLPEEVEDEGLHMIFFNLFGRIVPDNYQRRSIPDPAGERRELFKTEKFREEFERDRLSVTEQFDETGFLYHYEHGINLAQDVPLLHHFQSAYFHYLDLLFKDRDTQYRRDALQQENLSREQIDLLLERYSARRKLIREQEPGRGNGSSAAGSSDISRGQAGKVVYISYSWMLNDENMQRMLTGVRAGDGYDDAQRALLGNEYRYTMILVSDQDPEKSLAQLNAERENLKLFFQLIMQRIWMDRLAEQEYLEKRSQTIGDALKQFLHRAKGLMEDQKRKQEIQNLYDALARFIQPTTVAARQASIATLPQLFCHLLDCSPESLKDAAAIESKLRELAQQWFTEDFKAISSTLNISVLPSSLPQLSVRWARAVVTEAFHIILKNALEAALLNGYPDQDKVVRVQVQAVPRPSREMDQSWYVDIVLENPGGPIPPDVLSTLNSPTPSALKEDPDKPGSTGVGVYLARYQLQNTIGGGADLLFTNLAGGIVQSRLRLPAKSGDLARTVGISPEPAAQRRRIRNDYVLYVEDNRELFEQAVAEIESALASYNIDLKHARGAVEAASLIKARLPRVVFSDFLIPKGEMERESPALRHGVEFLRELLSVARSQSESPPIWVLTAEEESAVRERLGDVTRSGYRFVPHSGADPKELAEPGTICVFSTQKRPDKVPQFEQFLQEVFAPKPVSELAVDQPVPSEKVPRPQPIIVKSLSLRGPEFNRVSQAYLETHRAGTPGVVIVRSHATEAIDLETDLSTWFGHPGLPTPDPFLSDPDTNYRLTDHVYHQGMLLALCVDEDVFARLPIQLLYWGLSRNVIFESPQSDDQELARTWLLIHQEDRGPLSRLRHDLKNQWRGPTLEPILNKTITTINACEKAVLYPDRLRQRLDSLSAGESDTSVRLESLLKAAGDVEGDRKRLRRNLQKLDQRLLEAEDEARSLEPNIDGQRKMLHALDDYLGGS